MKASVEVKLKFFAGGQDYYVTGVKSDVRAWCKQFMQTSSAESYYVRVQPNHKLYDNGVVTWVASRRNSWAF